MPFIQSIPFVLPPSQKQFDINMYGDNSDKISHISQQQIYNDHVATNLYLSQHYGIDGRPLAIFQKIDTKTTWELIPSLHP